MRQPRMSSHDPLQSSSARLHASAGGAHAPQAPDVHVDVPVLPHVVVQDFVLPAEHAPESTPLPSGPGIASRVGIASWPWDASNGLVASSPAARSSGPPASTGPA